jgi:hypothetical protein
MELLHRMRYQWVAYSKVHIRTMLTTKTRQRNGKQPCCGDVAIGSHTFACSQCSTGGQCCSLPVKTRRRPCKYVISLPISSDGRGLVIICCNVLMNTRSSNTCKVYAWQIPTSQFVRRHSLACSMFLTNSSTSIEVMRLPFTYTMTVIINRK